MISRIRYAVFGALIIPLTSAFVASPSGTPTVDPGLEIPFTSAPPEDCVGCLTCGSGHFTGQWGPLDDYSPPEHEGCEAKSCGTHGICGGEEEEEVALVNDLETIRGYLLRGEIGGVRASLDQSPRVNLSQSRKAIQVTGCDGKVVAHFPLSQIEFEALAE